MVDGEKYLKLVREYYSFLSIEFDLTIINEVNRANIFYNVEYGNKEKIISISYENIEDYFKVVILLLQNGQKPSYDDKTRTYHLSQLNKTIYQNLGLKELDLNNIYFSSVQAANAFERKLLKSAKELRLYMKHFSPSAHNL